MKALIIGGHSGIGEDCANLLAEQYPEIEQRVPSKAVLDVENSVDIRTVIRMDGPFNYIIYSAGINKLAWIASSRIDITAIDTMDVNCMGFIRVISEHKRRYPSTRFSAVAVSSDAGRIPMRGSLAYCVSKAALNMAVKVMARELAPSCRINAVAPGMVEGTDMTEYIDKTIPEFRGWTPEYAREYERAGTPTERRATIREVSETIIWALLGPEQMTGAIIDINGGR